MLSKRISAVGFSAVAAAALMFSTGSAEAAKKSKELTALEAALTAAGTNTTNATPLELQTAVQQVATDNKDVKKFKLAVLLAEALKTDAAVNGFAGDEIAAGALAALGTLDAKLIGDAATAAASGKTARPSEIAPFAAVALGSDSDAVAAAAAAKKSKTAAAAILAGRAAELGTDALKTALVESALSDKKVVGAVVEISREVGAQITDPATFAEKVGVALASVKKQSQISKAVAGLVASKAEDAGAITESLLNSTNSTVKTTVIKGMSGYAKAVAAVADIEQISAVGAYLAAQAGANATKYTVANGLTKTLVQAIIAKPASSAELAAGKLSADNRVDEIAEVAAYVVGGILNNPKLVEKKLEKTVVGIIKSAISGTKTKNKSLKEIVTAVTTPAINGDDTRNLWADVAASVAYTLKTSTKFGSLDLSFLYSAKNLKAIAGKDQGLQTQVEEAIKAALEGTNPDRFENGNSIDLAVLVDPETDVRNF